MMRINKQLSRGLVIAALASAMPAAVHAQSAKDRALDEAVVKYTLTMPKVDAWARAGMDAARALKARKTPPPDFEREAKTIEEMAAQFDAIPELRRAIRKAGLSTKEYALLDMVMMQVQMFEEIASADPDAERPYNMNPANLAFARANKAAVEQKLKALQAVLGKQ